MRLDSHRALMLRVVFALTLIAALAAIGYAAFCYVVDKRLASVDFIRAAAGQATYSQRAALLSTGLLQGLPAAAREENRQDLLEAIRVMERGQKTITRSGSFVGPSPPIHALLYEGTSPLVADTDQFLAAARRLSRSSADGVAPDDPDLATVRALAGRLLPGFIGLVDQARIPRDIERVNLVWLETAVFGVTLLALILEALFIFRPMVRLVVRETRQLTTSETAADDRLQHGERGDLLHRRRGPHPVGQP